MTKLDEHTRNRLVALADRIRQWCGNDDPYAIELICSIEAELREIIAGDAA